MKNQFAKVFENDFENIQSFVDHVIVPIFGDDYEATPIAENILDDKDKSEAAGKANIIKVERIGAVERINPIQIFDITVRDSANIARSRVGIQQFIRKVLFPYSHAFMIFHYEEPVDREWRFSYLFKEDALSHTTSAKRYTYLFGRNQHCRTAVERFTLLAASKKDDKALLDAFSVEALTKQFYGELFNWYQWAINNDTKVTFPNNISIASDDREQTDIKIIRLITRLMFVWFIKQKDLVPSRLFEANDLKGILKDFEPQSTTSGNYYNAILQNLFFATLNRAIVDSDGKRGFAKGEEKKVKTLYRYSELFTISEREVIEMFSEVPFLNGGLFECLDKTQNIDGVEKDYYYDGFSDVTETFSDGRYCQRAFIPNILFFEPEKGLFSILKRYNFTIEENTPQEQQVALDPELLGKVFENLLGAYNPETRETARNQSGSFYTPREIVEYMVDASLIAYLGDTPLIRSLFSDDFQPNELHWSEYQAITRRLKSVKILDPACGSGAFPMGLLNRMVEILKKLNANESIYQLKLNLIESCIFGVDIQSIATQISKLRFFISLICDCEKDATQPNFGIPTLPNLETKFVSANSLIGLKRQTGQLSLVNLEIEKKKIQLRQVRHDHFRAKTAKEKVDLRKADDKIRSELANLLKEDAFYTPEEAEQLAEWNPYDQNTQSKFFDPEWMFGITDGFDIVIGNPPYIQLQNNEGGLAKLYEPCGFKTFARTGDIYCLFYERGWQLLKSEGHLCYITSNKWMRAGYGEKTRGFLANKTNPQLLIDFAGTKIFESATVDTNILLFSKEKNAHKTICAVINKQHKDSVKNMSVFVQQQHAVCDFADSSSWIILSPIEQSIKRKIESVGTPLKDWDINIYRGVLTGYNEAFIISTEKRNEILANCRSEDERKKTAELIRPILRGRDIKRYGYEWANLWLIWIPWHFPLHLDNSIQGASQVAEAEFERQYPTVYQHLLQYKEPLSNRNKAETGIRYEWYALQRWGAKYWDDFFKPKVVYPNMTKYLPFYYDKKEFLQNDKSFMIIGKHMAYLTAFFNSSVFKFCFIDHFPELLGGTRELRKIFFEKIPVLKISESDNKHFEDAVNEIQKDYSKSKAIAIDAMIFDLYKLTDEERQTIGFIEIR